jgi:hypothetical protein
LNHQAPQSFSGGLAHAPILEHPPGTGLANTIQGTTIAAGASGSIWLRPGVIPAEIILGNVALLLTLPSLAQISGQAVMPALWLMNATLAVGLVAAFRRPNQGGDRLITALASLIVASLYDSYAMWVASTNATALAIALVFAVPLLALAVGVGSAVRAGRAGSATSLLGAPSIPTGKLTVGSERVLLQGSDQEGIGNGA